MNKLISRTPVLRFKEGRKIEKFLVEGQPWAGYYTVGNWPRNEVTSRRKSSGTPTAVALGAYNRRVAANPELLNQSINLVGPQFIPAWKSQGVNNQMPLDGSYYEINLPEVVVVGQNKSKRTPKTNTTVLQQKVSPAVSANKGKISFKNAFNQARNSKQLEFTWNGKKYNTMKAGETKELWLANLNLKNIPTYTKAELIDNTPATPTILEEPVLQNDFAYQKSVGYPSSLSRVEQLFNNITLRPEFKYGYNNYRNLNPIKFNLKPMFKQGGQFLSRNPVERFKNGGILKFLNAGNLPTAPKAEDRYKNGRKYSVAYLGIPMNTGIPVDDTYYGESIKLVSTPNRAKIRLHILFRHSPYNNDTIYTEVPEHTKRLPILPQVNIIPRKGFSFAQTPEYEILKRRFNTAWNLAK